MGKLIVYAAVVLIVALGCDGKFSDLEKALKDKSNRDGGGLYRMNPKDFKKVVIDGIVHEGLVFIALFSTDPPCDPCREVEASMSRAAIEFQERHGSNNEFMFVLVAIDPKTAADRELAQHLHIEFVPLLYTFKPPKTKGKRRPIATNDKEMFPQGVIPTYPAMMEYIEKQTKKTMPRVRNGPVLVANRVINNRYLVLGVIGVAAVAVLWFKAYRSTRFWFAVVIVVLCFSLSGGHYTLIHNSPLFVWKEGAPSIIAPGGQRAQYFVEGIIWASIIMSSSALMLFLRSLPTSKASTDLRAIWTVIVLIALILLFSIGKALFTLKTPQYLTWMQG